MATRTPIRTCVACRRRRPQHDLVRLARTPDGVRLDAERRLPGRGAYVCPEPACIEAARAHGGRMVRRMLRGGDETDVVAALTGITDQPQRPEEHDA